LAVVGWLLAEHREQIMKAQLFDAPKSVRKTKAGSPALSYK
jgi:hypothetical protein